MAILRYTASADTTITNAFKFDMSTRGTGSNMGASDSLEAFSIYNQLSSSTGGKSAELSRMLVNFPISTIESDRTAGTLPAFGDVNFYLRMFNAEHASTSPSQFTLTASAITKDWEEGFGLDMESYTDLTYDGEGANWTNSKASTAWARTGGDYDFTPNSSFDQYFHGGLEDLELDITPLVEQWLNSAGNTYGNKSSARYGIGVFLTGTQEAYYSEADSGGILKNLSGSIRSYYTKKFFARGSEFFFKRPLIEARWDSSRKDNRSNFYFSSSIAPGEDNLNTIYLYNYVRGQLKNIPGVGTTGSILVSIYSGSADNTAPTGSAQQKLWNPYNVEPTAAGAQVLNITGSYVSTGIYSASFAFTGTSDLTTIYDVWHSGTFAKPHIHQYFTGTISTNDFNSSEIDPNTNYVMNIKNLRPIYSDKETARFRLFTRKKDWSPTIYTKATKNIKTDVIEDVYYEIYRVKDNHTVVGYGTGSLNHTRLSYDVSGSYFDLDMSMLQRDYMYGIKFIAYENGKYTEQSDTFKFRVE